MMLEKREKPKNRIKDHIIDVSKNVVSGLLLLVIPAIALFFSAEWQRRLDSRCSLKAEGGR